jgi:hypothetical protein
LFSGDPEFLPESATPQENVRNIVQPICSVSNLSKFKALIQTAHFAREKETVVKKSGLSDKQTPQKYGHFEIIQMAADGSEQTSPKKNESSAIDKNMNESSSSRRKLVKKPGLKVEIPPKKKKKNKQLSRLTGPCTCEICGKIFAHMHSLSCHIRKIHEGRSRYANKNKKKKISSHTVV